MCLLDSAKEERGSRLPRGASSLRNLLLASRPLFSSYAEVAASVGALSGLAEMSSNHFASYFGGPPPGRQQFPAPPGALLPAASCLPVRFRCVSWVTPPGSRSMAHPAPPQRYPRPTRWTPSPASSKPALSISQTF